MPNFKPWVWREVRLFELRILDMVARHYSIQKWPSSKPRVGSREDVTSSNQDITTNVATFVCRRGVWGSCFILHRVFLSTLALKKIMPSSRCVVQGCSNPSNPKAGISLHNSPVNPSLRAQWKRFVCAHRANFNPPGRFVVCSEHFTEDCFAWTIHVGGAMKRLQPFSVPTIWRKKDKEPSASSRDRRMVSVYHMLFRGYWPVYTFQAFYFQVWSFGTLQDFLLAKETIIYYFLDLRFFSTLKPKHDALKSCMPYVVVHV